MLPYVLFAYCEVSHSVVGFSPFDLLYNRDVRWLLGVLKKQWIEDEDKDILTYISHVRSRLELTKEIFEQNANKAQQKQREYYDQNARELQLNPGDKVLLLLPDSSKKFAAK